MKIANENGISLEEVRKIHNRFAYKLIYKKDKAKEELNELYIKAKELTDRYFKRFYKN